MIIIDLVIRDKRTNKTKGYGFVSFKDPADFTKAIKVSLLVSRTRLSLLVSVDFNEAIKVSFKDPADFTKAKLSASACNALVSIREIIYLTSFLSLRKPKGQSS